MASNWLVIPLSTYSRNILYSRDHDKITLKTTVVKHCSIHSFEWSVVFKDLIQTEPPSTAWWKAVPQFYVLVTPKDFRITHSFTSVHTQWYIWDISWSELTVVESYSTCVSLTYFTSLQLTGLFWLSIFAILTFSRQNVCFAFIHSLTI